MDEKRINCWEFMKCGREPGGNRADEPGVCPASPAAEAGDGSRKMTVVHLLYEDCRQEVLNRMLAEFSEKAASQGINCRRVDFYSPESMDPESGESF